MYVIVAKNYIITISLGHFETTWTMVIKMFYQESESEDILNQQRSLHIVLSIKIALN